MDISIIVCTYNRADLLGMTLESLFSLVIPTNVSVEFLLIDNNSTDATKEIFTLLQPKSPFQTRYVFESKQGLSHARNRGVEEAKGDILAFTDDDVRVENNWLVEIEKSFNDSYLACAGGRIYPIWDEKCPKWLTSELYNFLALLDLGDTCQQLNEAQIFGANFIVRAAMFKKYGLFETSIGRTRGKLYAGEESEFIERLLAGKEKIHYIPTLIVHHFIPVKRMKKSYFRKWIRDNSELFAIQLGKYTQRNILGIPIYVIKELLAAILGYIISLILMKQTFKKELSIIRSYVFIATILKYRST